MKRTKHKCCPGCSKHCKADHPRCKYGLRYFAKNNTKWESFTTKDSAIWHLLNVSRSLKKQLKKSVVTEKQLLSKLTVKEQEMLVTLLDKLL